MRALLLFHFAATWSLVGLCWLVQRVQYPLMARVGSGAFVAYARDHVDRIGPVVAPLMLVELATGAALLALGEASLRSLPGWIASALLVVIWLSTFAIQVPLHRALSQGFDPAAHAALVRTNWIRTLAWTLRGLLLALLLIQSTDL